MQSQYFASYIPITREVAVKTSGGKEPEVLELDAFGLMKILKSGDSLWLMMGSTNAAVAFGAFRRGVEVHQISYLRASSKLKLQQHDEGDNSGKKHKLTADDVFVLASGHPDLFYSVTSAQSEVLEIIANGNEFFDAMEVRKAYANLARSRIQQNAAMYGRAMGVDITTFEELAELVKKQLGIKEKKPADQSLQILLAREAQFGNQLDSTMKKSKMFNHIFGSVDGIGPKLAARFIAAIERIERFERPEDLSNYAGMLPRGVEGKMPSRRNSKGATLSRDPGLNTACFLFQEQMFRYGRNTELGQMLIKQVQRNCPCAKEERRKDAELRKKYSGAVKEARIAVTRYLLEKIIWPRWNEYMAMKTASAHQ